MSPGASDCLRRLAYQHSAVRSIVRAEWQRADRTCLTEFRSVPIETGGFEDIWRWKHERVVTVVEQVFTAIVEPLAARVSESLGDDLLREWTQLSRAVTEPRAFWQPGWEQVLEDLDRRVRAHVIRTAGSPPPGEWPEDEKELDVFRILLLEELLNGRTIAPAAPSPVDVELDAKPTSVSRNPARGLSKEAKALAALTDHPDWTDEQIAEAAGCKRQSLYRMKKFTAAKRLLKGGKSDFPVGKKNRDTGTVDAWDNDSDDDNE
jgi:hypothetical protein